MKLTILGSGNAIPQANRNAPGYLLEVDKKIFLIDLGSGTTRQLTKMNRNLYDITHIAITHTHVDHIADLPSLLWPIHRDSRNDKLFIYGPPRTKQLYRQIIKAYIPDMQKSKTKIIIKELKNNILKIDSLLLKTKLMPEKMDKTFSPFEIGYRFDYRGKSFCFCGDNGLESQNAIIDLAKSCDVLLIENGSPIPTKGHLHPEIIGKIATSAKVKKIILTHLPNNINVIQVKKIVSKFYKGQTIIAKDLMTIKI